MTLKWRFSEVSRGGGACHRMASADQAPRYIPRVCYVNAAERPHVRGNPARESPPSPILDPEAYIRRIL
ncbi:hypothetical protein EVAR_75786_1 [Eumeta japonica]|uniref:Uncharacterized protein n=1 Tax=Eumeta variegata TaxID=151549 RepID=A0A4C1TD09_EUMVA|nr:hypothetical protein EVAR_75786_1 [Eumeta japonica]